MPSIRIFLVFLLITLAGCQVEQEQNDAYWKAESATVGKAIMATEIWLPESAEHIYTESLIDGTYTAQAYRVYFYLPDALAPSDWLSLVVDQSWSLKNIRLNHRGGYRYEFIDPVDQTTLRIDYEPENKQYLLAIAVTRWFLDYK